ncbi:hypothetical protein LBMAG21_06680 [Armatimonadota bacterium]|nr:hypothetical protein LBMAG21_06680 [Armatimonadota bacterium]
MSVTSFLKLACPLRLLVGACLLPLTLVGCSVGGGSSNAVANNPSVTSRTAVSSFTLTNGSISRLTLNIFSNNTLTGSVILDEAGTRAEITILLKGTYDSASNFTASGQGIVNGTQTTITITGKLPPANNNTGGSAVLNVNGKKFNGTFNAPPVQNVFSLDFSNISGTPNANTSTGTLSNVSTLLSAENPGRRFDSEAKLTSTNSSRVVNVILRSADPGLIATGSVFPISFTTQPAPFTTTIVYGEEGSFTTGFVRSWVARSGTLIIDNIASDGTMAYRLINARMTPFTEVAGNPAKGSFTINYSGHTNINNGNTGGGGGGGGAQSAFTGKVLVSSFNLNNSQKGTLNLNVQGDGGITGTLRFDTDATRAVVTASLRGSTTTGISGAFTVNGTITVNGQELAVALTGTIATSGTGGSFTAVFGNKSFTGTFSAPINVPTLEQALFTNVNGVNGTTTTITFDDFNTVLNLQANPGEVLQGDARPLLNSQSRAISLYIQSAASGKIVPGAVFPILYSRDPSLLVTQVIYGENGNSSSGFSRMWVARSGTLVIDSINGSVITARLINCLMSPLSEVAGNQAQGTFTLDFLGRTTPPR